MTDLNAAQIVAMSGGRYPPRRPNAAHQLPAHDIEGVIEFSLDPAADKRSLTMEMVQLSGTPGLISRDPVTNEFCVAIPPNMTVKLTLNLSGKMDWVFPLKGGSPFSLAERDHSERYWQASAPTNNSVTLIIESSGRPQTMDHDPDAIEKFNLAVAIAQTNTTVPLILLIDPVTKNPPPVGGLEVPTGMPVPIY